MKKIGVIGAGVMGRGVAQSFAQTGHEVVLVDIKDEVLESAGEEIYNNIRMLRLFKKVEGLEDPEIIMERIHMTTELEMLREADIIVENVNEQWDIKRKCTA